MAVRILAQSRGNLDKKDIYKMTTAQSIRQVRELEGETVNITDWVSFADVNPITGEESIILSIKLDTGEVYATNSATVQRTFEEICDIFDDGLPPISVHSGMSKASRTYYYVEAE